MRVIVLVRQLSNKELTANQIHAPIPQNVAAAVLQSGADAVPGFAHCRIEPADGMEVVLIALHAGAVDFDLDDVGVDAVDRCAESLQSIWRLAVIPMVRRRSGQAFPQRREKWVARLTDP